MLYQNLRSIRPGLMVRSTSNSLDILSSSLLFFLPSFFFLSSPFYFLSYPFSCWLSPPPPPPPPPPPLLSTFLASLPLKNSPSLTLCFIPLFLSFFFSFCSPLGSTPQNPPPLPMFYGKVEKWVTFVGVWGTLCPPLFDFFLFCLFFLIFFVFFLIFLIIK